MSDTFNHELDAMESAYGSYWDEEYDPLDADYYIRTYRKASAAEVFADYRVPDKLD